MSSDFYRMGMSLYTAFTAKKAVVKVPSDCVDIAQAVCRKIGWNDTAVTGQPMPFTVKQMGTNKKVMLALSAGLDSTYLLYKLKAQGYEVTACHIAGLNKSSAKEEAEQAATVAKKAGVDFIKVNFKAPKQQFADNPFKNQLILAIMLDIGVGRGAYRYAVGSDWGTPLSEAVVGFTITDSVEVNRAFWASVKSHMPQAELVFIGDDEKKNVRLKYLYNAGALQDVSSCISPHRFREHLHKSNIEKYKVPLMPHRCGSCYKCSMEYLLLADMGLVGYDSKYAEHCWNILATSKTAHRPDLFKRSLPLAERMDNLRNYGS